jgi:hypothetical protein
MSNRTNRLVAALLCGAGIAVMANGASAMPATHALALKNAAPGNIETVRWGGGWRGGGWRGGRAWGWGLGGFAAGAIIGGALASPYYYGGYYPYAYYPAYPAPYPPPGYYEGPAGGGDIAYCQQRFRSYDPSSGTYLGLDGRRHPCP